MRELGDDGRLSAPTAIIARFEEKENQYYCRRRVRIGGDSVIVCRYRLFLCFVTCWAIVVLQGQAALLVAHRVKGRLKMPVHSMACPKCGKQSTEYDEDKWQCLLCGTSLYLSRTSPTIVNYRFSRVSITEGSLYDIEVDKVPNNNPVLMPVIPDCDFSNDRSRLKKLELYCMCAMVVGVFHFLLVLWHLVADIR